MQQDLLEAALEAHALLVGEVGEECGEALLEADGDVDALDLDGVAHVVDVVAEGQAVAVEVADAVVADAVLAVARFDVETPCVR